MKVYFTGKLYQKQEFDKEYRKIVSSLKSLGHEVLGDVFAYEAEHVLRQTRKQAYGYSKIWYGYLRSMDVCVAEISFPSTVNIGFEVATIVNYGKPVIAMHCRGSDPVFTSAYYAGRMIKVEYTLDTVSEVLEWALEEAGQWLERRFTMIIPAKIEKYLDEVVKVSGFSRSEYIRKLIENDMEKNK